MAIYVDELMDYGVRYGRAGPEWSHMTTDGDKAELHAFAARLGLPRRYFQDRPVGWHYDLTRGMRAKALRLGAVSVVARTWLPRLLAAHRAETTPTAQMTQMAQAVHWQSSAWER